MGYQDRDYYRDGPATDAWGASVVVKLIALNCLIFLANLFFGGQGNIVTEALQLEPDTILKPWRWYQFLTYGFAHSPQGLWHIGGNMLGLFFFGRALEDRFGWKEFLRFYLIAIVLGGIVWSLRCTFVVGPVRDVVDEAGKLVQYYGPSLVGASGGVTAVILLFCLLYPRATVLLMFVIPTPAWVLGLIIVVGDMFGGGESRIAHDVHLVGALFAWAYWYFAWNLGRLPGMDGLGSLYNSIRRSFKSKPDLRVVDPEAHYEDLDAEADALLDKVKRLGQESLTARERRTLEAYSRRMRQKLR
jgi:membrane associated rhomboid family serine protease